MGEDAYQLLGRFKNRVISVNKKIHGVYDRLGAAKWESYWWGGIVMQYHKHIYPGIMKRYRRQGYFNEERGTIEKGCYASIKDFLALPLRKQSFINKLKAENDIMMIIFKLHKAFKMLSKIMLISHYILELIGILYLNMIELILKEL